MPSAATRLLLLRSRLNTTPSPLLTGLVSYWKLNEASSTRVDVVSANNLTPTNNPTNTAGKLGDGVNLVGASTQYLSSASNVAAFAGNQDFTAIFWFKVSSAGTTQELISKGVDLSANTTWDWRLFLQSSALRVRMSYGSGFDTTNVGTLSNDTFYMATIQYTQATKLLSIQINNGTPATLTLAGTAQATTGPLRVGIAPSLTLPCTGVIDDLVLWSRLLTQVERDQIYNSGAGRAYPF